MRASDAGEPQALEDEASVSSATSSSEDASGSASDDQEVVEGLDALAAPSGDGDFDAEGAGGNPDEKSDSSVAEDDGNKCLDELSDGLEGLADASGGEEAGGAGSAQPPPLRVRDAPRAPVHAPSGSAAPPPGDAHPPLPPRPGTDVVCNPRVGLASFSSRRRGNLKRHARMSGAMGGVG